MGTVEKECDETAYGIDMAIALDLTSPWKVEDLQRECEELLAIAASSINTARETAVSC